MKNNIFVANKNNNDPNKNGIGDVCHLLFSPFIYS